MDATNRPDSAIIDYKKAYGYRLEGKKLHLLPDICINIADAYLHRSDWRTLLRITGAPCFSVIL